RNHNVGTRSRINLTYHVTPDVMAYYTYSQGFRPGGFNRSQHTGTIPGTVVNGVLQPSQTYRTPLAWAPDTLINNEVGAKTEWFNHRLQLNFAIYQEDWNNVIT